MKLEALEILRVEAAGLVRDCRRLYPSLAGQWTRKEWNQQCRYTGRSFIKNVLKFQEANRG